MGICVYTHMGVSFVGKELALAFNFFAQFRLMRAEKNSTKLLGSTKVIKSASDKSHNTQCGKLTRRPTARRKNFNAKTKDEGCSLLEEDGKDN